MLDFKPYLRRPLATFSAITADPLGSWERFYEQYMAHREGPVEAYAPDPDWETQLHQSIGLESAAELISEFWSLWDVVIEEMRAKGIQAGPESFKGWNDGDAAFVRAIWCLVRRLRPAMVVETGVAHGVTSRFILEAFERNGSGRLWSIDRPPMELEWREQIGVAVDDRLKTRWTYLSGSSRKRLPECLSILQPIDLFIHDSLHSERNVGFELDLAWPVLRPGGAIVVDDIDVNRGFQNFGRAHPETPAWVCEAEPVRPDLRRFNGKGLFGVAIKGHGAER
jgi:hypothetical protein